MTSPKERSRLVVSFLCHSFANKCIFQGLINVQWVQSGVIENPKAKNAVLCKHPPIVCHFFYFHRCVQSILTGIGAILKVMTFNFEMSSKEHNWLLEVTIRNQIFISGFQWAFLYPPGPYDLLVSFMRHKQRNNIALYGQQPTRFSMTKRTSTFMVLSSCFSY